MITGINNEDRLVQQTFADYLHDKLGWESLYAWKQETFGANGLLGRESPREVVLKRKLQQAIRRLNPALPEEVAAMAADKLTLYDFSRSTVQHNREFYGYLRDGVPVEYRDADGEMVHASVRVIDFRDSTQNSFLAVRELEIQGLSSPHYNRRADLVCFVNGLPLVFIELKAVYSNIRAGFDNNLSDYADTIPHAFYHNAFLLVSNGHRARYGSITSAWGHFAEWKRNSEQEQGSVQAQTLLDGMLAKERLLDLLENFILFDESKPGGTRKIIARNHQLLGVNNAVAAVEKQQQLKAAYPLEVRQRYHAPVVIDDAGTTLPLVERPHPQLGRLGVFWHTQGSGKSYSMAFFAEKVRRTVPGNFTFVIMTDREDLDDQIYRTFLGCGIADAQTPRAGSGRELKRILQENHRFVFSLIHKFNQDVTPNSPYSKRDDIIVISDEAHRTQAGKMARNMRMALPYAAFLGFTGTPLFKHDHLTRRIFGDYISRYDFKRSEEDGATVRLVYANRGEKLGLTRVDLNERIAEKIEEAELDPEQAAQMEKLLGHDYEVITADDRLDKIADDLVEHCATRWQAGKSLLVCIDKITCARMQQRILPRWQAKLQRVQAEARQRLAELDASTDIDLKERLMDTVEELQRQAEWMESSVIQLIISEAQNEVRDFAKWGYDIRPQREVMKRGFDTPDGRRVDVEQAFKDPRHPFRIAIVCAMWLTGFDVECLSTLYIDKPMKAHTLMQAIARANRVYPGKACGMIVDYNGMLKNLREALAQYAIGDEPSTGTGAPGKIIEEGEYSTGEGADGGGVVEPIEAMLCVLRDAIELTEAHLGKLGFDIRRLQGAKGFTRIEALRDAVDALYAADEEKRRFEIMARQVFSCCKTLLMEPAIYAFAERIDNIEAIYKKLQERRDNADVTALLKELHKIVNEAIAAQGAGGDLAEGITIDLSRIDFEKLREEFGKKVTRKHTMLQDIRQAVEAKLQRMLQCNPRRMDYYKRYQEIIADYNREKERATVEETFQKLMEFAGNLDAEERRAAEEGLSEEELVLFDMLYRENISKADRERLKQASQGLLASLEELLKSMAQWTDTATNRADVRVHILDHLTTTLPRPPYSEAETKALADVVYDYIWERSKNGNSGAFWAGY